VLERAREELRSLTGVAHSVVPANIVRRVPRQRVAA
jgi:hypothetical protein